MTLPNELHPGFFTAAGGAFTLDQSLRFNNAPGPTAIASLENTSISIQATSTVSMWIKLGSEPSNTRGFIFGASKEATGVDNTTAVGWRYDSKTFYSRNTGNSNALYDNNNQFRDFSAWYHLVVQFDANKEMTLFVNNVEQGNKLDDINTGNSIIIGRNREDSQDEGFNGYLADIHYVDGQILTATNFAGYNEYGVWVPQKYSGSYGSNGFHLTFDSSGKAGQTGDGAGIGADHSPNNNHFTPSGFDTADVVLYSDFEAGSGSTYQSDASNRTSTLVNAGSAFDGNTGGGTQVDESAGGYWYLTKTLNNVSGLKILMTGQTSQIADTRVNGSTVTTSVSGNYIVVSSPPSTVTEVAIRRNTANTQVYQVEVDTGSGFVALLDTPTPTLITLIRRQVIMRR